MSLLLLWNGAPVAAPISPGGVGAIIPGVPARRPTQIMQTEDELLVLLALNPWDTDLLLLVALANYEPR